jgi:hypothetical protein
LAAGNRFAGAVIMALFSVEILLKCLICRNIREQELPRIFEEHDLEGLLMMAGLRSKLQSRRNRKINLNWAKIQELGEKCVKFRYVPESAVIDAAKFKEFQTRLEDPNTGVFSWLKRQL